jgi:hypothetical protein
MAIHRLMLFFDDVPHLLPLAPLARSVDIAYTGESLHALTVKAKDKNSMAGSSTCPFFSV